MAVGQIIVLAPPGSANSPPVIGRIATVATDANIIQILNPPGNAFGSGVMSTLTLTDAQLAAALASTQSAIVPGTIIEWDGGAVLGKTQALVLQSAKITLPSIANPFTGEDSGEVTAEAGIFYVEVLKQCNSSASLGLGGERLLLAGPNVTSGDDKLPVGWTALATVIPGVVDYSNSLGF
jgi:hypothetical protein